MGSRVPGLMKKTVIPVRKTDPPLSNGPIPSLGEGFFRGCFIPQGKKGENAGKQKRHTVHKKLSHAPYSSRRTCFFRTEQSAIIYLLSAFRCCFGNFRFERGAAARLLFVRRNTNDLRVLIHPKVSCFITSVDDVAIVYREVSLSVSRSCS